MSKMLITATFSLIIMATACSINNNSEDPETNSKIDFYYGADLSYVNEMEDCGASYNGFT